MLLVEPEGGVMRPVGARPRPFGPHVGAVPAVGGA
jgi:hypothetical protein